MTATYLEPGASLRSRLKGSSGTTVSVVALSTLVRGAIALTTGLDPNEGVDQLVAGVGSWANSKSSSLGIAPVAPFNLACGLLAVAACVELAYVPIQFLTAYTPVSTMKWASQPAADSSGAKLLM